MVKKFTQKFIQAKLPDLTKRPLQLYNMFSRNFEEEGAVFPAMTDDLERVAELGFKAVYIPPFTEVGHYPKSDERVGSLYATRDLKNANAALFNGEEGPLLEDDGEPTKLGQQVKAFCEKSRSLGMVPMFDLVQGHLSPDSPYIEQAKTQGIDIVKTHSNGKVVIYGLDENHKVKDGHENPRDVWDDIADLNFEDETARKFIIKEILIPHARNMATLGFRGIRIDSAYRAPKEVQQEVIDAFKARCRELDGAQYEEPPILGETLDDKQDPAKVKGLITHNYASTYWFPRFDSEAAGLNVISSGIFNTADHALNAEIASKQTESDSLGVSTTSTHDEPPLLSKLKQQIGQLIKNRQDYQALPEEKRAGAYRKHITRAARIKIAFSAFFTPGGYMLCSGDEFLSQRQHSVFDGNVVNPDTPIDAEKLHSLGKDKYDELLAEARRKPFVEHTIGGQTYRFTLREVYDKPIWRYQEGEAKERKEQLVLMPQQLSIPAEVKEAKHDDPGLPKFIKQINDALGLCKESSPDDHADFFFSHNEKGGDLAFFARYQGNREGGERSFKEIVLVNVSSQGKQVEVTQEVLDDIKQQTRLDEKQIRGNLITAGDITIDEKIKNTVNPRTSLPGVMVIS